MVPPNPIIGSHVYNWYECSFKIDMLPISGVLSVAGGKVKAEQEPQYGTDREPIDIATGKIVHDPITITMYAHEWQKVKAILMAKSLGRGWAHADFIFIAIATGNPIKGAPPVGDVWAGCKASEIGVEYGQDVNGFKRDLVFQPRRHRDIDGMTMHNF